MPGTCYWKAETLKIVLRLSRVLKPASKGERRRMWSTNLKTAVLGGGIWSSFLRHMSQSRAVNVRKINPKVPIPEAKSIANSLYEIIKQHGPLTIPNTWVHAKEAGVSGLNSKTHMKIMLKWMRGRKMLKLLCNQTGSSKKFFHTILPEDPAAEHSKILPELKQQTEKRTTKQKSKIR